MVCATTPAGRGASGYWHEITDEDLRRLSPPQHEHIKMLGHFPFALPQDLTAGA